MANKVILVGRVGVNPSVRNFDNGGKIAQFTFATTERAYKVADREIPERTEWHNITSSGSLAGVVENYVHKGDKLYIEGKLRTRSYEDKDGIKRYITEIHIENMEMLTPKAAQTSVATPQVQTEAPSSAVQTPVPQAPIPDQVDNLPF